MSDVIEAVVVEEEFEIVGDSVGEVDEKIEWYQEIQAACYKSWLDKRAGKHSMGSRAMLQSILPRLNELRVEKGLDPREVLPKSYTNKNAGALLQGMRTRIRKRIEKKDKATIEACLAAGVIKRKEKAESKKD